MAQLTLEAVSTCPLPQALMGAVHYLPAVGTPLLIKPLHRPIRRHDTCSAALSQPTHTPSLCVLLAGRDAYEEVVQAEGVAG